MDKKMEGNKRIIEYNAGENLIELHAFALSEEEHTKIRKELEEFSPIFDKIDGDSIICHIRGDYAVVKKLETLSWSFYG